MPSPFTPKTLAFLRSLKRHNDRDWFREHKGDYERHVIAPMTEVLGRLAVDFRRFAPELVSDPKVSLFRIYRDTRFSEDKTPLKTAVGARFPTRGFAKGRGAGLYFEIAPGWVWIGGGLYRPEPTDLIRIRARIAESHPALRRVVSAKAFRTAVGTLHGDALSRVPRGFPADHPAADYLRMKQFLGFVEKDAAFAVSDDFYPTLVATFKALVPLVRFLNAPLRDETPRPFVLDAPSARRGDRW